MNFLLYVDEVREREREREREQDRVSLKNSWETFYANFLLLIYKNLYIFSSFFFLLRQFKILMKFLILYLRDEM
jgi:hypothetical protein